MFRGLLLRIQKDRERKAKEEKEAKTKAKEEAEVAKAKRASLEAEGPQVLSTKSTNQVLLTKSKSLKIKPGKRAAPISTCQPPPPGTDEEARKNALLIRIKKEREKKAEEAKVKKDAEEAEKRVQNGGPKLNDGAPTNTLPDPKQVLVDPAGSGGPTKNLSLSVAPVAPAQFCTPPPPIAAAAAAALVQVPLTVAPPRFSTPPPPIAAPPPAPLTGASPQFSTPPPPIAAAPPTLATNGLPDLTRPPPPRFGVANSRKRPHGDIAVSPLSPASKKPAEDTPPPPPPPAAGNKPLGGAAGTLAKIKEMVEKATTPLCNFPYDDQLASKEETATQFLGKLRTRITVANGAAETYFWQRESCTGSFVKMERIVRSAEVDGYRSKCNFAVGINPLGKQLTVGFRLKPGVVHVGPVEHLRNISDKMKRVVARVEGFLRELNFAPRDPATSRGIWTELSVRLTKTGEMMLVFHAHPQSLSELQLSEVEMKLVKFSRDCLQPLENLTSLYLDNGKLEHMLGTLNVKEEVGDKLLQISPQSFFPCNLSVVKVTCEIVGELAALHAEATLVDVCCGTGTIAVYLSDRCGQVLGLDALPIAIEDARMNALSNDITNGEFHPGSAEEYLGTLWRRAIFNDVVRITAGRKCSVSPATLYLQRLIIEKKEDSSLNNLLPSIHRYALSIRLGAALPQRQSTT